MRYFIGRGADPYAYAQGLGPQYDGVTVRNGWKQELAFEAKTTVWWDLALSRASFFI